MTPNEPISPRTFEETDGLADWRVLSDGGTVFYGTRSLAESARLVQAIAALPGIDEHPPAVDIRASGVTVSLISRSEEYMGMTRRDAETAQRISVAAGEMGLRADPSAVQGFLVIPGAPDIGEVTPFWRAALGYRPRPDSPVEDLVDPQERLPGFWFETMEQPRPDGGGAIHVAIWVPHDLAEERVASALAAGGSLVRDDEAPAWWTLADSAGNQVDIATSRSRE